MTVIRADATHAEAVAQMNKRLIEDERHPNPMNVSQLADRMREWLRGEYACCLATENGKIVAYCLYRDAGEFYYAQNWRQLARERRQMELDHMLAARAPLPACAADADGFLLLCP